MKIWPLRVVALALFFVCSLTAQPADDTQLKQVIIFGRHSVRAPVAPIAYLNNFSVQQFPDFGVAAGILTPNGETLATVGGYYGQWLTQEGILTGNDTADANFVFSTPTRSSGPLTPRNISGPAYCRGPCKTFNT